MQIDKAAFFGEVHAAADPIAAVALEQLRAGWPLAQAIRLQIVSAYAMGLSVGLAVGVSDVAVARAIVDWIASDQSKLMAQLDASDLDTLTKASIAKSAERLLRVVR